MRNILFVVLISIRLIGGISDNAACQSRSVYDYSQVSINGAQVQLSKYQGKVLLITNTASKCGFTPQYHDLQQLYSQYKDQGLEILGFPSNDFAGQEPLSNTEIKKFCALNFGVTFPLFERGAVSGPNKQPLFKYLTEDNPALQGEIGWNFEKFLIGRDGKLKARFGSFVNPESQRIRTAVENLLLEKVG